MKINRLLEMTILLINRGTITAKELANRFQVSTRTIYRDIDVLSSTGVPVYTSKGTNGGIHLMENYALNKAMINEHEIDSLMLALKTMQVTRYPQLEGILDKMGSLFKNSSHNDWVKIDFSPWGSGPDDDNKFLNVKMAILNRRVITFDYVNSQGGKSYRNVEPQQLIYKGQAWYLWGFCKEKNEGRTFRISRIKNLFVTDQLFERRVITNDSENIDQAAAIDIIHIKLRFQPDILHRVYDDYEEEMIERNLDGTCDVTFHMSEDEWVYGYILSFGHYVEVLEPLHLKGIVQQRLKKALSFYE